MTNSSPKFIVGTPRSGTTLVRLLLDSHPDLAIAPESAFLFRLAKRAASFYGDLDSERAVRCFIRDISEMPRVRDWFPPSYDISRLLTLLREGERVEVSTVLNDIYSQYASGRGKTEWGDKTPRNVEFFPEITALFPEARFLIVVRDCRDVFLSLKEVEFGKLTAASAATRWKNDARRAQNLAAAHPSQVKVLKYEDLLQNPDPILKDILRFFGLREDVDLQALYLQHSDDVKHEKSKLYRKPITAAHLGQWKKKITERELAVCEFIAGAEMELYGYERQLKEIDVNATDIKRDLFRDKVSRVYNKKYLEYYLGFSRLASRRLLERCAGL